MIKNQRQYAITKKKIGEFLQALEAFKEQKIAIHPLLRQAQEDGMKSQLADFKAQVEEYEQLKSGNYQLKVGSFQDISIILIRARIALGLTQKDLAKRLGLDEQQIQRYEDTEYASASFARIVAVAEALGLEIEEEATVTSISASV